ncbi:hypothetical protein [Isoalcanivorax indicus]|uniref:hypothetical protein n=1 Tax=Isoalcanivorax indicus TaxID=2202653 RepID=UPI000DBA6E6E|nr:hypothetical protein [Isoalcanivorax indicus]
MNENERVIRVIELRRRMMLIMFVVAILIGLFLGAAALGWLPLDLEAHQQLFQSLMLAYFASAMSSLVFMGMMMFMVRGAIWGIGMAVLGLVALMGAIPFVAAIVIIVANRMAEQRIKALRDAEAEKVAAAQRAAEQDAEEDAAS